MKKIMITFCIIISLTAMFSSSLFVEASSYDTFTHFENSDGTTSVTLTKESYIAEQYITAATVGIEDGFKGLVDICYGSNGKVYLLCSEISCVVVLNSDFTLNSKLALTDETGVTISFSGAKGIYVDSENRIYICDTANARIIVTDSNGKYLYEFDKPESNLLPKDFMYQPCSIAKDSEGYTYILSLGCYYGALLYSPENEFLGFYGSNTVKTTALDTLGFIWDKITGTDAKREVSAKKLPFSFVDLIVDYDDFAITCTGAVTADDKQTGQIRKISPTGVNILYKQTPVSGLINSDSVNFLESEVIKVETKPLPQNIVSLDVNKQGYIFALDKTVGLVYVYDSECNLISAFGGGIGYGVNLGQFTAAEALAVNDNNVLVIDSTKMSVTVFTLTDYGNLLQKAQSMYLKGDYYSAKPYWEEILKTDRGNQLAYRGLAVASQSVEDYTSALEYAKNGLDYQTYDAVWQTMVTGFLGRNFAWLLTAVLLSVLGIVLLGVKIKKRRKVLIQNPRIKVLTAVPFHPFTAFDDIKYKNQGSVKIAFIITIIFFLASVLQATATGFVFSRTDVRNYNVLVTIVQTVGIVALWTVGNWLVSSLFSGIGKLREIFIVTAYSLLPIICCIFIQVVLSHFLPLSGMPFFETLRIVALIYTFFLLCIGIMRVHEFNFFKFLGTGFVTLFSMIIVVFIMFMVVILLQQFWNFIYSIIMEIVYR